MAKEITFLLISARMKPPTDTPRSSLDQARRKFRILPRNSAAASQNTSRPSPILVRHRDGGTLLPGTSRRIACCTRRPIHWNLWLPSNYEQQQS
ncbi:hypothetical protein HaLaN_29893, partial [Haematococcus lacustris]